MNGMASMKRKTEKKIDAAIIMQFAILLLLCIEYNARYEVFHLCASARNTNIYAHKIIAKILNEAIERQRGKNIT